MKTKKFNFSVYDDARNLILVEGLYNINPYRTELFYGDKTMKFKETNKRSKKGIVLDITESRTNAPLYMNKFSIREKG